MMSLEPNTDAVLARDYDRHCAPEDQDEDEFDRFLRRLGDEARDVLTQLIKYGDEKAIVASFWCAREQGKL